MDILCECGVQGTLRQYLLMHAESMGLDIQEADVDRSRLNSVDGLAMVNSVFGLWPVSRLDGKGLGIHQHCVVIQAYLHKQLKY